MQNLILTLVTVLLLGGCTIFLIGQQRRHTRRLSTPPLPTKSPAAGTICASSWRPRAAAGQHRYTMIALDVADFTFLNNLYGVQAGDDGDPAHLHADPPLAAAGRDRRAQLGGPVLHPDAHTGPDEITGRLSVLKQRAERYDKLGAATTSSSCTLEPISSGRPAVRSPGWRTTPIWPASTTTATSARLPRGKMGEEKARARTDQRYARLAAQRCVRGIPAAQGAAVG